MVEKVLEMGYLSIKPFCFKLSRVYNQKYFSEWGGVESLRRSE